MRHGNSARGAGPLRGRGDASGESYWSESALGAIGHMRTVPSSEDEKNTRSAGAGASAATQSLWACMVCVSVAVISGTTCSESAAASFEGDTTCRRLPDDMRSMRTLPSEHPHRREWVGGSVVRARGTAGRRRDPAGWGRPWRWNRMSASDAADARARAQWQ